MAFFKRIWHKVKGLASRSTATHYPPGLVKDGIENRFFFRDVIFQVHTLQMFTAKLQTNRDMFLLLLHQNV